MNKKRDEKFMRAALNEAKKALGSTSPNPAVGAVLVVSNRIVGKGHHRGAGHHHAEVECLRNFDAAIPPEATLYVTLEPCSTEGRTAPCTEAILRSGVRNIVVGAIDPNPRHSGKGLVQLRNAGVSVREGVLADDCAQISEAFNKWIVTGRPLVIAKCGISLDGRLARPLDELRWITGASARRHAHKLRARVDSILVGANTVRTDNPRLTVRGIRGARQPWRVVLTRSGKLSKHAHVFSDRFNSMTLTYQGKSLAIVLKNLGKRGITSVLIEGGGNVLGQALDARLIDKVQIYLGPILTGGPVIAFPGRGAETAANALRLRHISYRKVGQTVCVTAYPDISKPE
jgi:diaminohydroxyphosphoribosylaminopyrimidine deaminase/5-amino-6-(5-phosphoribosylamino)uracil reductase